MASIINRRDVWYARVKWYESGKKHQATKEIPLKTKSKVTARERLSEVNKVEDDIKQGMEFSFPWLSDSTTTKVQRFTIHDAVEQWLSQRSSEGIRQSTIRRNRYSSIRKYLIIIFQHQSPQTKYSSEDRWALAAITNQSGLVI